MALIAHGASVGAESFVVKIHAARVRWERPDLIGEILVLAGDLENQPEVVLKLNMDMRLLSFFWYCRICGLAWSSLNLGLHLKNEGQSGPRADYL
jgi:hypothetical protein